MRARGRRGGVRSSFRWRLGLLACCLLLGWAPWAWPQETRPVSFTVNLLEGYNYWLSPPLQPDPAQGIVDAATLEAEMKRQFALQGVDVSSFELGVARWLPEPELNVVYPDGDSPCLTANPFAPFAFTCVWTHAGSATNVVTTEDLTWRSDIREAISISFDNGGNGGGQFTWSGIEVEPPAYGYFAKPNTPYMRSIPVDGGIDAGSDVCAELSLPFGAATVTRVFTDVVGNWLDHYVCGAPVGDIAIAPGEGVSIQVAIPSGEPDLTMEGTAFFDVVNPGIYDPGGDIPTAGRQVRLNFVSSGFWMTRLTENDGTYSFQARSQEDYFIEILQSPGENWTPLSYGPLSGNSGDVLSGLDFGHDGAHDLGVDLFVEVSQQSLPRRFPCSTASPPPENHMEYCVRYQNTGAFKEEAGSNYATATLRLPDLGTGYAVPIGCSPTCVTPMGSCTAPPLAEAVPLVGDTMEWEIPDLDPGEECTLCVELEVLQPTGDAVSATVEVFLPDGTQDLFAATANTVVRQTWDRCATDPNDKWVDPQGCGPEGYINDVGTLRYRVRFENEGEIAAQRVVIYDTLDQDLDEGSYRIIGTSHPLTGQRMVGERTLELTFDGINLPPNSVDPEGSQGFVLLEVDLRPGLPSGTSITNTGSIVFDLNDSIETNTVVHTFTDNNLPPDLQPGVEICNGIDDDCDGVVDPTQPEICDGLDNDCNGLADEGDPQGGSSCDTGQQGVCGPGTSSCGGGVLGCFRHLGPGPELCNGIDDNCDGVTDDVLDEDQDGHENCSDNCPADYNPGQEDGDSDNIGDICDCAPADPANPAPQDIGGSLVFSENPQGEMALSWDPVVDVGAYNVYRGYATAELPWSYNHECFRNDLEVTSVPDPTVPFPGGLFYYLVSSSCPLASVESGLGLDSFFSPRPVPYACPAPFQDSDGDGIEDARDNCPDFRNPAQGDQNGNGIGDVCDREQICDDDLDDDGDGLVDCQDPDCDGVDGCEFGQEVTCDDAFDNDADISVDCQDSDCQGIDGCGEILCDDLVDNDGDGPADCLDSDCNAVGVCEFGQELTCDDSSDNDGDGPVDCADPDCQGVAGCPEIVCDDSVDNDGDGPADCLDLDCDGVGHCEFGQELTCDDSMDNDGDGPVDCADPDCQGGPGCPELVCDDGIDNDTDGDTDCEDLDCDGIGYCQFGAELTCDDLIDNDGDGAIDCEDTDCQGHPLCPESICDDGLDNDGDGDTDCLDLDCNGLAGCEFGAELTCGDGLDNDGDGDTDCADLDCNGSAGCEFGSEFTCDDAFDNDGDGDADCADLDCDGTAGCEFGTELTCDDGTDNDGDGDTDCDDIDCAGAAGCPAALPPLEFPIPGKYLISLPRVVGSPSITSAQELLDALDGAGLDPVSVAKHNTFTDALDTWTGGACSSCGGSCFCIDPMEGLGYMVHITTPGELVLTGTDSTSTVFLYGPGISVSGSHFISLPFSSPLSTAADLLADIGPSAVQVSRYITVTDSFETYAGFGPNFPIVPGEGYLVRVVFDTAYTPATGAGP